MRDIHLKQDLMAYARSLGFERVGVTSSSPLLKEGEFLSRWLAEGRAGEMGYLERQSERRSRPADLLPGAKSVIALAMTYGHGDGESTNEGRIARYAWGKDYHKVIGKRLDSFVRYLEALSPDCKCRTFVDTGPLLERGLAQRAGLGFIGKNTMLITKGMGSWVFLASVVSTLELPADAPDERTCGECRLCIDACPTQAITAPFELDPRRCIAYLTIESERAIPEGLRPKMGGWIFGCDICQEACPHNTIKALPSPQPSPLYEGRGSKGEGWLTLSRILDIQSDEEFRQGFEGTPLMRSGREGLLRNACVAAANLGRKDLTPRLLELSRSDSSPIVREHAAAALETLV